MKIEIHLLRFYARVWDPESEANRRTSFERRVCLKCRVRRSFPASANAGGSSS